MFFTKKQDLKQKTTKKGDNTFYRKNRPKKKQIIL